MQKTNIFVALLSLITLLSPSPCLLATASQPNIVIIYADDLGYGDVGCYGATAVETPHIDRIAAEGIRFTDGHAASATCTPSRYAMLTGEYAWRQQGTGIARGDAPAIIKPGRATLASMLQNANYKTGVVGKWHLGMGPDEGADWNGKIAPGPLEIGFDYCYLIPATGDRVPCVYVENHHVVDLDPQDPIEVSFTKKVGNEPTGHENPGLLKMHPSHGHDRTIINGISRIGYMTGGKSARWVDEDMADRITQKAVAYIEDSKSQPFFLFFSLHDIHVPRVPHPRFVGSTSMGPRGDAIAQADWCTGQIMDALDRLELADNTIVLFTSDNGPVIDDGYQDDAVTKLGDHRPAGPLRGGKYSSFEGGTRVPFILRWPAKVKAKQTSNALVCQIDLLHSFASLTGQKLADNAGPDSFNILEALLGNDPQGRDHLVEHARTIALRQGDWKYLPPGKGPRVNRSTNTELGIAQSGQLYNLQTDLGERKDLAEQNPERSVKMKTMLEQVRSSGSSR